MTELPVTEYSHAWAIHAEGARIGIVTCQTCGAALVLDPVVNVLDLHTQWHGSAS